MFCLPETSLVDLEFSGKLNAICKRLQSFLSNPRRFHENSDSG
jgi:hypothetical protein